MEGRSLPSVVVVATRTRGPFTFADASSEVLARAAEVTRAPAFRDAFCYGNAEARVERSQAHFLTVYECAAEDPWAAYGELGLRPMPEGVEEMYAGGYRRIASTLPAPALGKTPGGLLVGLTDCEDEARRDELEAWYEHVHAKDVLRFGKHHSGHRFERVGGEVPQLLALYETEEPEPDAFRSYLGWEGRDARMCDACTVRHVWTFNRLFPQ